MVVLHWLMDLKFISGNWLSPSNTTWLGTHFSLWNLGIPKLASEKATPKQSVNKSWGFRVDVDSSNWHAVPKRFMAKRYRSLQNIQDWFHTNPRRWLMTTSWTCSPGEQVHNCHPMDRVANTVPWIRAAPVCITFINITFINRLRLKIILPHTDEFYWLADLVWQN